ncbi:MAG: histone [Candidatus Heimdallarchaeota archaeon]
MISQVWIFSKSGIPIASRAYGPKIEVDETLLTGMLSALFAFAKELEQGTIEALRMTNLTLYMTQEKDMLFVIGTTEFTSEELIAQVMKQTIQIFFQIFPEDLIKQASKQPRLITPSMMEAFQKKLDQLINQQARNLSVSPGYDLEKAIQTFLAVAREELSPTTAIDELLKTFGSSELKIALKQVIITINGMLSVAEQLVAESPLQELLNKLSRYMELWGKTAKISMLGLDRAGKTAILNTIQGKDYHTTPTTTFSVERIKFRNLTFACWDMPGQDIYRTQWIPNTRGTHILVFVIDGADSQRWEEAIQELKKILEEFPKIPLALLLNKNDLPNYAGKNMFEKALPPILRDIKRPFCLFETSAVTLVGLEEVFQWIFDRLTEILPRQQDLVAKRELPLAPIDRLIKTLGAERVNLGATEILRDILEDIAITISESAMELARHAKRNMISKEDIRLAFSQFEK